MLLLRRVARHVDIRRHAWIEVRPPRPGKDCLWCATRSLHSPGNRSGRHHYGVSHHNADLPMLACRDPGQPLAAGSP